MRRRTPKPNFANKRTNKSVEVVVEPPVTPIIEQAEVPEITTETITEEPVSTFKK